MPDRIAGDCESWVPPWKASTPRSSWRIECVWHWVVASQRRSSMVETMSPQAGTIRKWLLLHCGMPDDIRMLPYWCSQVPPTTSSSAHRPQWKLNESHRWSCLFIGCFAGGQDDGDAAWDVAGDWPAPPGRTAAGWAVHGAQLVCRSLHCLMQCRGLD